MSIVISLQVFNTFFPIPVFCPFTIPTPLNIFRSTHPFSLLNPSPTMPPSVVSKTAGIQHFEKQPRLISHDFPKILSGNFEEHFRKKNLTGHPGGSFVKKYGEKCGGEQNDLVYPFPTHAAFHQTSILPVHPFNHNFCFRQLHLFLVFLSLVLPFNEYISSVK